MQKTRVKQDSHGLYFRAGGYLFRPVPTSDTEHYRVATTSQFAKGDPVKVSHIACTSMGRIKRDDHVELWSCHGQYISHDEVTGLPVFLDSDMLFREE
jgi:hypothetical protein